MLDVVGLNKTYEGSGRTVGALRDLTFSIGAGELVCLVGPSGGGKTTLLKCIAGLMAPTRGTVQLAGKKVDGPPEGSGRAVRRSRRLPVAAVRGHAASRGHRARHRLPAAGPADGRAARRGRRPDRGRPRGPDPRPVTPLRGDDPVRHPRHRRAGLPRSAGADAELLVRKDLAIDLPDERDQLSTRSSPRLAELRTQVYAQIQHAKNPTGIPDPYDPTQPTPQTVSTG